MQKILISLLLFAFLTVGAFAQMQIKNSADQVVMHITQGGTVGIGLTNPDAATKLDVNGKLKTSTFQMTTGATNGYILTSDASGNATWQAAPPISEVDGVIGNEILNVTNATLVRSGSGTSASPYTVALNLANANTWTALQTFTSSITIGSGATAYTMPSAQGTSGQFLAYNGTWQSPSIVEFDGVIGNEILNVTNATLVRSGSGTSASPYTVALNLANANTWTALQTFQSTIWLGNSSTGFQMPATRGTSGYVLTSDGAGNATWQAVPSAPPEVDGVIGNEILNVTNATLVRAGSGTSASPYTVALNLANPNTWTSAGIQTFTNSIVIRTGSNRFTISTQ